MFKNLKYLLLGLLIISASVKAKFNFGNKNSVIEFAANSFFEVNQPIHDYSGTLRFATKAPGNVSGQNIFFSDGNLGFADQTDTNFTGTLQNTLNQDILLQNNAKISFVSNKEVNSRIKVPSGATVYLSGAPLLKQPIELADATSTVYLALKSNLGQDIYLNGGTIVLEDDLRMSAGTKIWGGGTININKKQLVPPSGNFADGDLSYLNAQDVTLVGDTTYTTNQAFSGTNNDFFGGGSQVTLAANNGRITVNAAATFRSLNTYFKGISGTSNVTNFGVFNVNATGTAYFRSSTLELNGNYTQATGTMVFLDECKLISRGFTFNVTGAAQIIVDGTSFGYDNLDSQNSFPFTFTDRASQLKLLNGGNIHNHDTHGIYNITTTSGALYHDFNLSTATTITVTQPSTILNGNGFTLHCPSLVNNLLILNNNATLQLTNISLENFHPNIVSYGTGSSMSFGTETEIYIIHDLSISGADKNWNFNGADGLMSGINSEFQFTGSNNITVGAGCTLVTKSLHFAGLGASGVAGIFSVNATGTMEFDNCTLDLAGNYTHSTGTLLFHDNCKIVNRGFTFNVTGAAQIIVDSVSLIYDNLDSQNNFPFTFTDKASQLKLLNGGNIHNAGTHPFYNISTTSGALYHSYHLSANTAITVTQPSTTLNGNGFTMYFPSSGSNLLNLNNNATLTFTDVILNGFNQTVIGYGTGSSINFGTNTRIRLFSDVTISGSDKNWNFTGTSGQINGVGSLLDFTGSNNITIGANNTVLAKNLHIEGLGASGVNGIFSINSTGTLVFDSCTLELEGNYTHSSGTMTFRDNCKIAPAGFNFNVTGAAQILINGYTLEYDNLDGTDTSPFTFTDQASQLKLLNGGNIRSTVSRGPYNLTSTSGTLYNDYILSASAPIAITQPSTTLNGGGFTLHFPSAGSSLINFSNNATLTVNNIVFNNFNPATITYGTGASMNFGVNTKIRLFDDLTLSGADKTWAFTGNGEIVGSGNILTLNGSSRITVTGANTLTLKNLHLILKNSDSLAMLSSTSKIVLENCTVYLEAAGYSITTGNLDFAGLVSINGGSLTAQDITPKLSFASAGQMRVLSSSILRLGKNLEFEYKADPSGDAGITFNTKRHFRLVDPSSTLELAGCTLHSTLTGLAIDSGRMLITDSIDILSDGSNGRQLELGSALELYVGPAVALNVTGTISYNATSF